MPPVSLSETPNGYPTINVEEPYQLFGEALRAEHSVVRAKKILLAVERVLSGELEQAEILQDYGKLSLNRESMTVKAWVDFLSNGAQEEQEMPLDLFRKIVAAWLGYLEDRLS